MSTIMINNATRRLSKLGSLALLVSTLSACSSLSGLFGNDGYFRDRGDDYLKAEEMDPIKIPEGADETVIQPLYVIPKVNSSEYDLVEGENFEVPRPQPLAANMLSEKVKIQKLGNKRWVLINTPPSEAWPRVRNFLTGNGLQLAAADAVQGYIETAWLKFKEDEDFRHRYQVRIEQGVQPDSTEIHVLHASESMANEASVGAEWPGRSDDREKESWMIDELATNLASEDGGAATSLLAQTIGGSAKVEFAKDGREPLLNMALAKGRAMATVGHSVRNGGFHLLDENTDLGIFYVAYAKPEDEDGGWFSGLWSSGDPESISSPYSLQDVLDNLKVEDSQANRQLFPESVFDSASAGSLDDVPGFLVLVTGDKTLQVRIRDAKGRALAPRHAKRLLTILRQNLI